MHCTVYIEGHPWEVEVTYHQEGRPAKIDALPEDCYPAEPAEVEWEVSTGNYHKRVCDLINHCLDEATKEDIERQLLQAIAEAHEDDR